MPLPGDSDGLVWFGSKGMRHDKREAQSAKRKVPGAGRKAQGAMRRAQSAKRLRFGVDSPSFPGN